MSRRTKKHRNANTNLEEINGEGKKQESARRKRLPHYGTGRNEHGFMGGRGKARDRNGGRFLTGPARRRYHQARCQSRRWQGCRLSRPRFTFVQVRSLDEARATPPSRPQSA